jgi:hypothetical protein
MMRNSGFGLGNVFSVHDAHRSAEEWFLAP